jgi:N-acyl-D-amino-acid deacylase
MTTIILRGGSVVDGSGSEPYRADVEIAGGVITGIGDYADVESADTIQCNGRLIFPGFIDTHSHLDAGVFRTDAQLALLRQGVTSVIAGQDGVSYAPGDGGYATRYFASINGSHPTFSGGSVADLLKTYQGTIPINVGYLVPQGIVRHNVMGLRKDPPTPRELAQMVEQVEHGIEDGALGLSTGLDYVPGYFADTDELIALCAPVARRGGVYVSHLRGYREPGVAEAAEISRRAGVPGHISHYHGPTADMVGWLEAGHRAGADLTFDAYPYARGCTNLTLLTLPPWLLEMDPDECIERLGESDTHAYLDSEWLPERGVITGLGPQWATRVEFTYVAAPEYAWAEGLSMAAAAERVGRTVGELTGLMLQASRLEVGATVPFSNSTEEEAQELANHPSFMCGSDGIYFGSAPHPRGWGSFARVLSRYCRKDETMTWGTAAWKLSGHAAHRFGLTDRGQVAVGAIADLAIVDPAAVQDNAKYRSGRLTATGVSDVLVAGSPVLRRGELTGMLTGRPLIRSR